MGPNLLDELPRAQRLALSYAPASARAPTLALLALDARLAAILRKGREPVLAQMRLAWWRDTLAAKPETWPGGDAVLDLLRQWRAPAGLTSLVDGWEALLGENLDHAAIDEFVSGRAQAFAQLAVQLGVEPGAAVSSARVWALGDLAANLSESAERAAVVAAAADMRSARLPRELRALAVLAGLGRRSLARGGGPLLDDAGALFSAMRLGMVGR
jgi:phytoene synthase